MSIKKDSNLSIFHSKVVIYFFQVFIIKLALFHLKTPKRINYIYQKLLIHSDLGQKLIKPIATNTNSVSVTIEVIKHGLIYKFMQWGRRLSGLVKLNDKQVKILSYLLEKAHVCQND